MLVMLAATIVTNLRCLCYCSTKVQYILSYRARYCAFVLLQYTGTVHTVIQGALLYVCVTAVQRYSTYCHTARVTVRLLISPLSRCQISRQAVMTTQTVHNYLLAVA